MRSFKRGQEPESLAQARQKEIKWEDLQKTEFGHTVKEDIRKELAKNQRECCAYCEVHINTKDNRTYHIEHLQRQSDDPSLALNWDNLFLSCNNPDSCGRHKDNKHLQFAIEDVIDPSKEDPQDFFWYSQKNGQIFPKTKDKRIEQRAKETIRVFNLDKSKKLCNIRQSIAANVSEFLKTEPTEQEKTDFLESQKEADCFSVYCHLLGRKTQQFD